MTISFQANYIQSATIKKAVKKSYKNTPVSFVELNPFSNNDKYALRKIGKTWGHGYSYARDIQDNFEDPIIIKNKDSRFFAISEQMSGFDKLKPSKVLGLIETSEDKGALFIDLLQCNPEHMFASAKRKFKEIGKALIDSLKDTIPQKEIILSADEEAIPFYLKQGFKMHPKYAETNPDENIMHLVR